MFLALLWMERWLKFLSEASAQYAPLQLTHMPADEPGATTAKDSADAAVPTEESALLQDALEEREQALAGLLLARSELLSQLARISAEAEQERTAAAAQLTAASARAEHAEQALADTQRAVVEAQAVLNEAKQSAELVQAARAEVAAVSAERDAAQAERDVALAGQRAWAVENERLKDAQRRARVQVAVERAALLARQDAALLAERQAWAGENERLKAAQRHGRVRSAAEQRALLVARSEAAATQIPPVTPSGAPAKAEAPARKTRAKTRKAKAQPEIAVPDGDVSPAAAPESAAPAATLALVELRPKPARTAAREAVAAQSASGQPAADELVLGFRKPADWAATAFVYYWDTDPLTDRPDWPGVPMQAGTDGWFVHHFQGIREAHLIFTDDAGHQTPNLHRTASGWLDENGEWQAEHPQTPA